MILPARFTGFDSPKYAINVFLDVVDKLKPLSVTTVFIGNSLRRQINDDRWAVSFSLVYRKII